MSICTYPCLFFYAPLLVQMRSSSWHSTSLLTTFISSSMDLTCLNECQKKNIQVMMSSKGKITSNILHADTSSNRSIHIAWDRQVRSVGRQMDWRIEGRTNRERWVKVWLKREKMRGKGMESWPDGGKWCLWATKREKHKQLWVLRGEGNEGERTAGKKGERNRESWGMRQKFREQSCLAIPYSVLKEWHYGLNNYLIYNFIRVCVCVCLCVFVSVCV